MTKKILALIPARGGSKRLPGKNMKLLGGMPLVVWPISVVKGIAEICDIMVSTDDPQMAQLCTDAGAMVPWLRPPSLAKDDATSVDVAIHALDWYEATHTTVDGLLLLQPTSPFRTRATIQKCIELFSGGMGLPVVSVSPTHHHPMWTFKLASGFLVPYLIEHGLNKRSQDLEPAYVVNGNLYLVTPSQLRDRRSFFGEKTIPLILETQIESIDIDTEWDFSLAEKAYAEYMKESN